MLDKIPCFKTKQESILADSNMMSTMSTEFKMDGVGLDDDLVELIPKIGNRISVLVQTLKLISFTNGTLI